MKSSDQSTFQFAHCGRRVFLTEEGPLGLLSSQVSKAEISDGN